MLENLLGKVACYGACGRGHNCFGCFLNDDPLADKAVEEIKRRFEPNLVNFWPKNNVGLRFVSRENEFLLDGGELQQIK